MLKDRTLLCIHVKTIVKFLSTKTIFQTELKEHEEALKKVKGQIERIEDEETREQAKLMDVRHELEKYVMKMKENQQKIRHFRNEVLFTC